MRYRFSKMRLSKNVFWSLKNTFLRSLMRGYMSMDLWSCQLENQKIHNHIPIHEGPQKSVFRLQKTFLESFILKNCISIFVLHGAINDLVYIFVAVHDPYGYTHSKRPHHSGCGLNLSRFGSVCLILQKSPQLRPIPQISRI